MKTAYDYAESVLMLRGSVWGSLAQTDFLNWSGLRESNPYPLLGRQVPRLSAKPAERMETFNRLFQYAAPTRRGAESNGLGFRASLAALSCASLIIAGCSQEPIVRVQYVNIPTYIPVPVSLTQPISVDLTNATWGSGMGALNAALQACNARLDAIHTLVPPPVNPLINP